MEKDCQLLSTFGCTENGGSQISGAQSTVDERAPLFFVKRLIKKAKRDKKDLHLATLDWRSIPTDGSNVSPIQKLQFRRTHTLLPTPEVLMQPEVPSNVTGDSEGRKRNGSMTRQQTAKYQNWQ